MLVCAGCTRAPLPAVKVADLPTPSSFHPPRSLLPPGWREVASLRKKLEDLTELRELVRQLGRGGGKGPLKKAPEQVGAVWRGALRGRHGDGSAHAAMLPPLSPAPAGLGLLLHYPPLPGGVESVATPPFPNPFCPLLACAAGLQQQAPSGGHPLPATARGDAGAHPLR